VVVPVGPHQVGQHLGVACVGLGSRGGVAISITRCGQRVDGVDLVASGQEGIHHQASVDLDADDYRFVIASVLGDQFMQIADPNHAVGHSSLAEHRSVLGHHADVVMVLGPVHSYKEHCSSSRS
jgi:hypothetical protein